MENSINHNKEYGNCVLGNRIKQLRKANNITQAELAKTLYCSTQLIADYEHGRRKITERSAELLANKFKVYANYFLDEKLQFKTPFEELLAISDDNAKENALLTQAISALASLGGYSISFNELHDADSLNDMFLRIKKYMVFSRNGEHVFTLSQEEVIQLGNSLYEIFMSLVKINWDKRIVFDIKEKC